MLVTSPDISTTSPSRVTSSPWFRSNTSIDLVSTRSGTFVRRSVPSVTSPAAISGRAAFFAPLMEISPVSGTPPSIFSLSMIPFRTCRWRLPLQWRIGHPLRRLVNGASCPGLRLAAV